MRPRFELVSGTSTAAERRLISVETIRLLTGIPETGEGAVTDAVLELRIDGVMAQIANSCRLAAARGAPLTLAQESVRATWTPPVPQYYQRWYNWFTDETRTELILPWRAPITTIDVTVDDESLEENVGYELLGSGVIRWLDPGTSWPWANIVVDYTAGFVPLAADPAYQEDGETLPADVVNLIAQQVQYSAAMHDPALRSEDIPGIWSGSFNVPGGDAISSCGLILPLYDALSQYRGPPVFA
jgi:hypothetical protein